MVMDKFVKELEEFAEEDGKLVDAVSSHFADPCIEEQIGFVNTRVDRLLGFLLLKVKELNERIRILEKEKEEANAKNKEE